MSIKGMYAGLLAMAAAVLATSVAAQTTSAETPTRRPSPLAIP